MKNDTPERRELRRLKQIEYSRAWNERNLEKSRAYKRKYAAKKRAERKARSDSAAQEPILATTNE